MKPAPPGLQLNPAPPATSTIGGLGFVWAVVWIGGTMAGNKGARFALSASPGTLTETVSSCEAGDWALTGVEALLSSLPAGLDNTAESSLF